MMGSPFSKRMISCQIIAVFFIIGFGCGTDPESKNVGSYRINVYSGNNQFAEPQEFLDAPVVFQITDKTGKPLSDLQVRLSIIIGGGSLDRNIDQTDQDGLVSVNWRIGADVDQIMKAEVTDGNDVNSTSWALANSSVHFNGNWVSGLVFIKNFSEPFEHDNRTLETDHFLIFSNAESDDGKVIFAKIAEEHLKKILDWYKIQDSYIGLLPSVRDSKIKIYAHTDLGETGAWCGAQNSAIIHPSCGSKLFSRQVLCHEIAHMVELLIIKPENFVGLEIPIWFVEGIADFFADFPTAYPWPIDSVDRLDQWWSSNKNPISIITYEDMGSTHPAVYYTMFGLIFKYWFDSEGHHCTNEQTLTFYNELIRTRNFTSSFEKGFNVSITELQDNIYFWLRDYLTSN